jgi:hypothetical protein
MKPGAQENTGGWPVKIWSVTEKIMCAIVQRYRSVIGRFRHNTHSGLSASFCAEICC